MKVCFLTLGCKVNQQESAALIEIFKNNGYTIAKNDEISDVYIVNSCTVTLSGDRKSIQWINKAKRQNPNCVVALIGCMPQAFPQKAEGVLNADIIIGTKNKNNLINLVNEYIISKQRYINISSYEELDSFEELSSSEDSLHTRAFLKIQDGCNRECAYCIIPKARGKVRSRPIDKIIEQANLLSEAGHKEIVLTGVNISCYGQDLNNDVCDAIEAVSKIEGIERVRLGSLELDLFTDEMLVRLSTIPKFCPHFHLSLQSGCDKTLKAMNRLYDTTLYENMMNRIRELFDNPTFTTDIIVGFPNETEEDFLKSVRFVQKCQFLKVHCFSFSPREGTTAAKMDNQIEKFIKQDRNKTMTFKSEQIRERIIKSFIGTKDTVLLEKKNKDGFYTGYTSRYIPVLVEDNGYSQGQVLEIEMTELKNDRLICKVL